MAAFRGLAEGSLKGAKELDAQLRALGAGMAPKVLRGTLRDAMRPTFALYRAKMRVGTKAHRLTATYGRRLVGPGFSRRNTYLGTTLDRNGGTVRASIGPRKEAFYNLWFNETAGFRGGSGRRGSRAARRTRTIPADPRLVPIFKASRSSILSSVVSSGRKRIQAIASKRSPR